MPTSETRSCRRCGGPLPQDGPDRAVCAACLLSAGGSPERAAFPKTGLGLLVAKGQRRVQAPGALVLWVCVAAGNALCPP